MYGIIVTDIQTELKVTY